MKYLLIAPISPSDVALIFGISSAFCKEYFIWGKKINHSTYRETTGEKRFFFKH